jgi:hypothetical protein
MDAIDLDQQGPVQNILEMTCRSIACVAGAELLLDYIYKTPSAVIQVDKIPNIRYFQETEFFKALSVSDGAAAEYYFGLLRELIVNTARKKFDSENLHYDRDLTNYNSCKLFSPVAAGLLSGGAARNIAFLERNLNDITTMQTAAYFVRRNNTNGGSGYVYIKKDLLDTFISESLTKSWMPTSNEVFKSELQDEAATFATVASYGVQYCIPGATMPLCSLQAIYEASGAFGNTKVLKTTYRPRGSYTEKFGAGEYMYFRTVQLACNLLATEGSVAE